LAFLSFDFAGNTTKDQDAMAREPFEKCGGGGGTSARDSAVCLLAAPLYIDRNHVERGLNQVFFQMSSRFDEGRVV
jgi:hypothetical protein